MVMSMLYPLKENGIGGFHGNVFEFCYLVPGPNGPRPKWAQAQMGLAQRTQGPNGPKAQMDPGPK